MKLSKADIQLIEWKNKIKLLISRESSKYLKEILTKNKSMKVIRKVIV